MSETTAQAINVQKPKRYKEYLVRLYIEDAECFDSEAKAEGLKGATYMRSLVLKNMKTRPVSV